MMHLCIMLVHVLDAHAMARGHALGSAAVDGFLLWESIQINKAYTIRALQLKLASDSKHCSVSCISPSR